LRTRTILVILLILFIQTNAAADVYTDCLKNCESNFNCGQYCNYQKEYNDYKEWYYKLEACTSDCSRTREIYQAAYNKFIEKLSSGNAFKPGYEECLEKVEDCQASCGGDNEPFCYTNYDCPDGYLCKGGECVYDAPDTEAICSDGYDDDEDGYIDCDDDDCYYAEECMECYEDSDCPEGYVCEDYYCVPFEEQYSYELYAPEKEDFYMNGLNQVEVMLSIKKMIDDEWVAASGESVKFELDSWMTYENIGSLSSTSVSTDGAGHAKTVLTIPLVSPKKGQWIGKKYIQAQVKAWHMKGDGGKQGLIAYFNLYPPIYVKRIKFAPKTIEEGQFAQVDIEISNTKDSEVYVLAGARNDLVNNERNEATASSAVAHYSKDAKVRFYVYTTIGDYSISFDDIPDGVVDYEKLKKAVATDLIHTGIDTAFSVTKYGKMASDWSGNWKNAVKGLDQAKFYGKGFLTTPSNYSPQNWPFSDVAQDADTLGQSRSASEGFWNSMVLVVDGTKYCVGVLSGSLPGSNLTKNAKMSLVNAYLNRAKEIFKNTAQAIRVAKSIRAEYPRVLYLELEDEDGYTIEGRVGYYVIRNE